MKVVTRKFQHTGRDAYMDLWPLGDVHIGHRGADEKAFSRAVARIKDDPNAYWVGMGDHIDAVGLKDPRFSAGELADWVRPVHLKDLVSAQRDRFLELTAPIHDKCLAVLYGNHERTIHKYNERHVHSEILAAIKPKTPWAGESMDLGYTGFLLLRYSRTADGSPGASRTVRVWLHHGAGGGRLKGAKALGLQRIAWSFDCDLAIHGHVHDEVIEPVNRVGVTHAGKITNHRTMAFVSGAWMRAWHEDGAAYSEQALYFPGSVGTPHCRIRPWIQERGPDGVTLEGMQCRDAIQVLS